MDVSRVSEDDGIACARLMEYLRDGIDLRSGKQVGHFQTAITWLTQLANKMALELSPPKSKIPSTSVTQEPSTVTEDKAAQAVNVSAPGLPPGVEILKYNPGNISMDLKPVKTKRKDKK